MVKVLQWFARGRRADLSAATPKRFRNVGGGSETATDRVDRGLARYLTVRLGVPLGLRQTRRPSGGRDAEVAADPVS